MKILGIETSCDETAAAVVEDGVGVLSDVVASSQELHQKTGGIVPEVAAREQIRCIIPVVKEALSQAFGSTSLNPEGLIDAIAVTIGPGLIGSLLVGVETAKVLSFVWQKPLVSVNHLIGHIYGNLVTESQNEIEFPAVVLVVSGGHTELVLMKDHGKFKWLGGTRDDAAGEAFDKVAKMLNLGYPGGPAIQKVAENGNPVAFDFPRPLIESGDFDFSFSGLKTAVSREIKNLRTPVLPIANLAASFQQAVVDVLLTKTSHAAQGFQAHAILLAGGVAANQKLRNEFKLAIKKLPLPIQLLIPPLKYCTDNAVVIASAAYFNFDQWKLSPQKNKKQIFSLKPDPNLRI